MKKPPVQTSTQRDMVQTAVRLPRELHGQLKSAAELAGRSLNAEIIARLQASPVESIASDLADIKSSLRKLLDAVT